MPQRHDERVDAPQRAISCLRRGAYGTELSHDQHGGFVPPCVFWVRAAMSHVMNTYARLPVAFERGEGVWLWDTQRQALSRRAGRHRGVRARPRHPALRRRAARAGRAGSCTPPISTRSRCRSSSPTGSPRSPAWTTCSSATPAARRTRRRSSSRGSTATSKDIESPAIVVMEKAFHGRTIATLSATGSRKVQAGFEPLVAGFVRVPFDDLAAVKRVARGQPQRGGGAGRAAAGRRRRQRLPRRLPRRACARSATRTAGCSCSTRCRAAWAAPASGSRSSTRASCPT